MDASPQPEALQEFWKQQVDAWKHSGLSGAKFCEANQLVYHRFVYWRQKFSAGSTRSVPSVSSGGFVAVSYANDDDAILSVSLPNGLVIRGIRAGNISVVRQLLDAFR